METSSKKDKERSGDALREGQLHYRSRSLHELGKLLMLEKGPTKSTRFGPGRYSSEVTAMGTNPEVPWLEEGPNATFPARKDRSGLLDAYEIKVITKELCRYIESSRSKSQSRVCPDHGQSQTRKEESRQSHDKEIRHKKKLSKGFWIGPAVVCGFGAGGVVAPAARARSRHSHSLNHKARATG